MCTMNTGLNVASDAACAIICNSEDYLIFYVMSYSPIHWKSIIEITLTVGIFGILSTSPEKISPLVSNVAHWVGGRSRERQNKYPGNNLAKWCSRKRAISGGGRGAGLVSDCSFYL